MPRDVETGPTRERVDGAASLTIETDVTERYGLLVVDVSEQSARHSCWIRMRIYLDGRLIHGSGRHGGRVRDVIPWFLSPVLDLGRGGHVTAHIYSANGEALNVRARFLLDDDPIDPTQFYP